jgi:phosphonate transport system permease protein
MGVIRSIPDLLYAVLFVAALGIGPVAGIPALAIFSAGIIAKMTSESTDNIDRGPLEAIESTGATKLPMVFFAVIPQILPLFLSYTLYVFEINIRIAAVLAYVGAGGIGLNLISALQWFDYPEVATILIVIFVIVFFIDYVSGRFRESLVEGKELGWLWKGTFATVTIGGIIAAALTIDVNYERVAQGAIYFGGMLSAMVNVDWSQLGVGVWKMTESIHIALIGTTISMLLAFPFGFLCAGNLGFPKFFTTIMRQIPNAIRTFPEIILAIFFIATYGPGAFPGVMAIAIHSVGMLSRLNYEIVETIDRGPLEALTSIGAGRTIQFRFAVLPQVIPEFIAMAIYRFEINIRAATTLGIVGAGGIGALVVGAVRLGRWEEVGMYMLIVIVFVNIIDTLSAWARRKIIEG